MALTNDDKKEIEKIVQKEVKKIFNNSKNDEQFLDIVYNTFKLKEKTK
jgi:hypothetical protein